MREADISITMNVHGNALMESKANSAVVIKLLRKAQPMRNAAQQQPNPVEQMTLLLHRVIPGWRFR